MPRHCVCTSPAFVLSRSHNLPPDPPQTLLANATHFSNFVKIVENSDHSPTGLAIYYRWGIRGQLMSMCTFEVGDVNTKSSPSLQLLAQQ